MKSTVNSIVGKIGPDMVSGLIFIGFSLCLLFWLIPQGIVEPKNVRYAALSPSYYPKIIAFVLLILGVVIIIQSYFRFGKKWGDEYTLHAKGFHRTSLFIATLIIYAGTLNILGFVLGSSLALFVSMTIAGERNYWIILGIALILPMALYLFFLKIARIPIPTGILSSILAGV